MKIQQFPLVSSPFSQVRSWPSPPACGISDIRQLSSLLHRDSSMLRSSNRIPDLKKEALNSWSAVQDTFYSTKDTFERHKIVFSVGTSIASIVTAWIGYSLRHYHDTRVDRRLDSIEQAMKQTHHVEPEELKRIVSAGNVSLQSCAATAGTALLIGYGLGWRGGRWYANRKFRKEQMKLLGQMKPKKWRLPLTRSPFLARHRLTENHTKQSEALQKDAPLGSSLPST